MQGRSIRYPKVGGSTPLPGTMPSLSVVQAGVGEIDFPAARGVSGLGRVSVSGRTRVPRPATASHFPTVSCMGVAPCICPLSACKGALI